MSVINTHGDEIVYGEVIPGWNLIQLKNTEPHPLKFMVNNYEMVEGSFGLSTGHDPCFTFDLTPMPHMHVDDWTDEYEEAFEHYLERLSHGYMESCYYLRQQADKEGYVRFTNGESTLFSEWMMNKMGEAYLKYKDSPKQIWTMVGRK